MNSDTVNFNSDDANTGSSALVMPFDALSLNSSTPNSNSHSEPSLFHKVR